MGRGGEGGMEGVYIDTSAICYIDGRMGRLYYRGYDIEELHEKSSYEEVTFLLWYGRLPKRGELEKFRRELAKNRRVPEEVVGIIEELPKDVHPMGALRTLISYLGNLDGEPSLSKEEVYRKGLSITAKMPTLVANLWRMKRGMGYIEPDKRLSHAANFLYMLHGEEPSKKAERAMDAALILYAEHEINASAFTVMTVGSTLSDYYSAVVAGIGALKGPLHGGAVEEALNQFTEIGSPENAERWFFEALKEGRRIMGAGHRVYKTYDPRARIFKHYARELGDPRLFAVAERLEGLIETHLAKKGVHVNVDYWAGIVFRGLNIPPELYTAIFAMGRIAGWTAHLAEYLSHNRLIRPRLKYVGEIGKRYVPVEERG